MKRKLIPFWMMPGSWGLRGKTKDRAEAEYYLDGEALARRLIEIDYSEDPTEAAYLNLDIDLQYEHIDQYTYDVRHAEIEFRTSPTKLRRAKLEIDRAHGKLDHYTFELEIANLDMETGTIDKTACELRILDAEFKHNKISEREYKLKRANLLKEPYVAVVKSEYDPREGVSGLYFEFDWNDLWIEYLKLNGYVGFNEEQIVESWFADVCRAVADDNVTDDDPGLLPFRGANRVDNEDGSSDYY